MTETLLLSRTDVEPTAQRYFITREMVRPGTFIAAVGADNENKQEIDPRLLAAATVVTDLTEQASKIGDLHHAIVAGTMSRDAVHAELGEIVAGRKRARASAEETIVRSFADGFIAIVLPAYLLALGMGQLEVGFISTATLLGSASMTLAVGRWGHRFSIRRLLLTAAMLMAATGVAFAGCSAFWPLLVVAFFGTLNPSSGDASVFMPLDHTMLATASDRTGVFARYSFLGTISGAVGALAAGLPEWLGARLSMLEALRLMFVLYAAVGVAVWLLYLRLPEAHAGEQRPSVPLGPSRGIVWRLAALFSVDSFAGGLVLNSLLALWLFER